MSQIERSKLLEERVTLEQERKSQEAALNALLYRPAGTHIGSIPDFDIIRLTMTPDTIMKIALENNPRVKKLRALIGKSEAQLKLAYKDYYPDFNVFFEWGIRYALPSNATSHTGSETDVEGLNVYSAGVNLNIPIQLKRRAAAVKEANSSIRESTENLNSYMIGLDAAIVDLTAKMEKASKLVTLYQTGIIPQARQTLESSLKSYHVNNMIFQDVLSSRTNLFNYERKYYENMAEYEEVAAELEALAGSELY